MQTNVEKRKETSAQVVAKIMAAVILVASSLFALYTSGFGLLSALTQRTIHWAFMASAIFLVYPVRKKNRINWVDILLALGAAAVSLLVTFTWQKNALRILDPSPIEIAMYIIGILFVLEATRRSMGMAMPMIAIIFLLYAMFGRYFPGILRHKGVGLADLASFTYSTTEGVFGLAMGTSATYIIIFVLFGSFLAKSGTGQLFVDLSLSATGRSKSGSAYATILSNALMGIISGSPVANVVTTGSFTLPLLRRSGYPMQSGAALLAVAACGSMFTPPVMGAAAFLVADYLSVPYGKVVLASLFPALLFYISLFVAANVGATKGGLTSLSREDMPDWKAAVLNRGHLLIPIILLVALIVYGYSALKSAFFCVLLILVLTFIKKSTRMSLKAIKDSLVAGSRDALSIAAACACAGIIVGVVSSTGLGVKFSSMLMQMAGSSQWMALVLTMIAALILGMGLPPTAVYIVLAALTAPALIKIGIAPMAAHFFIFYFSCVGAITPPVALAAYSASAIAHTNPFKTGWKAFRMGLVAYIVPYMFAANPVLLLQGDSGTIFEIILSVITALIGVVFLTWGVEGFFRGLKINVISRVLFIAGALMMMIPGALTDGLGIAALVVAIALTRVFKSKPFPAIRREEEAKLANEVNG